ncbi:hypothetical protein [uncultured Cetobacterium sp.]|uniref:structural cement protein Gp24 n=1 Tax=uncultured Cetobacterium sp. TaxID=527638 RepID=UPI00261F240E|nr:hypothetical protein [uncultured Cetobacterium sp.]
MKVRMAGHIARTGVTKEFKYSYSEEIIPFGAGVMRGTNKETQCKLMNTGGQFLGVALFKQTNSYDEQQWGNQTTPVILTRGFVYVQVSSPVVAGDKAACGEGGKFAKSTTASYDDIEGVFETSSETDGYAILRLR